MPTMPVPTFFWQPMLPPLGCLTEFCPVDWPHLITNSRIQICHQLLCLAKSDNGPRIWTWPSNVCGSTKKVRASGKILTILLMPEPLMPQPRTCTPGHQTENYQ
jgi:hypothetical protein